MSAHRDCDGGGGVSLGLLDDDDDDVCVNDGEPIDSMLSTTPQPLPDLIDPTLSAPVVGDHHDRLMKSPQLPVASEGGTPHARSSKRDTSAAPRVRRIDMTFRNRMAIGSIWRKTRYFSAKKAA